MSHFDSSALQKLGVYSDSHVAKMSDAVGVICMQIFDCFRNLTVIYGALRRCLAKHFSSFVIVFWRDV